MVGLLGVLKQRIASTVQSLVRPWDAFWFQPEDPLGLGVLRILTGLMLVYTHLVWGIKFDAFLGPHGFQDPLLVQVLEPDSLAWSFWGLVADAYCLTVHWVCISLLVLYTLGLGTTVTKWAAPLITISYANRAPNANFGLDQFNAMLAVYLALGPCGERLSLDRLLRVHRHGLRSLKEQGHWSVPQVLPSSSARLVTRLIQVHMCVVYFFAGVSKLKGEAWWTGDAVWMAISNTEYQTIDLTWIAWYPWISNLATHVTILWEMTFWIYVWKPAWRPWVLLIGAAMHIGIGAFLGMWTFGLIMMFTYVSYIPPEKLRMVYRWIATALPQAVPVPVLVDGSNWKKLHWASWRKTVDWRNRLILVLEMPAVVPPATVATRPRFITGPEWWAENKHSLTGWPFAACDRLDIDHPRVMVVHALLNTQCSLQNYFHSKGYDCRAVSDIPSACTALFYRPTDVVLLWGQPPREVDDLLLFRDLLLRAGASAPASVTVLTQGRDARCLIESPDHLLLTGSVSPRELRNHVTLALQERTCTDEEAALLAVSLSQGTSTFVATSLAATRDDLAEFEVE